MTSPSRSARQARIRELIEAQAVTSQTHLAALLAWIDPPDGLTGAEAAARAEDPVAWPPAGPLTDPTFDPAGGDYRFGWGTGSTKPAGPSIGADNIGPIDAVLLSHDLHDDNLDAAGRALLRHSAISGLIGDVTQYLWTYPDQAEDDVVPLLLRAAEERGFDDPAQMLESAVAHPADSPCQG